MMKVRNLLIPVLAAGALAACNDYDPGLSDTVMDNTEDELATISAYTHNFVGRYGAMGAEQDWGFSELEEAKQTRYADPNSNMWATPYGYLVPPAISEAERKAVVKAFRVYANSISHDAPDCTDFFIQDVYKGGRDYASIGTLSTGEVITQETYRYTAADGQNKYLSSDKLSQIYCVKADGTLDEVNRNNFNNKASESCQYNHAMLMRESGIKGFTYHNSASGGLIQAKETYIFLNISWNEDGVIKYGTYVGIDFFANGQNPNEQVAGDGKFDDWIFKVTPAIESGTGNNSAAGKPTVSPDDTPADPNRLTSETKRVMCEDLGSTYDFDFNDLVFDVYYTYNEANGVKSNITAHVTVQAAGGTLPVYVGKDSEEYEAHKLLNSSATNTAINVGGLRKDVAYVTLENCESTDPNDIDIYVDKGGRHMALPKSKAGNSYAPQKICVPQTVQWPKEGQQIEWGYGDFTHWVSGKVNEFWGQNINREYLFVF